MQRKRFLSETENRSSTLLHFQMKTKFDIPHRGKYRTAYRLVYSTPWEVPNCLPDGIFYTVESTKLFTGWYIPRRGKYQTAYRTVYSTPWEVPTCLPDGIFYTVGSTNLLTGWYIPRCGKYQPARRYITGMKKTTSPFCCRLLAVGNRCEVRMMLFRRLPDDLLLNISWRIYVRRDKQTFYQFNS